MKKKKVNLMVVGLAAGLLLVSMVLFVFKPTRLPDNPKEGDTSTKQRESDSIAPPTEKTASKISAQIKGEQLYITYNSGEDWKKVPVKDKEIMSGEYTPSYDTGLMPGSYFLNKEHTAFLLSNNTNLRLIQSFDQGKTWQEDMVSEQVGVLRYRKLDFLDASFGYLVFSGGRTMSQESSELFLTYDQGKTWKKTSALKETSLLQYSGFIDSKTGFISYKNSENKPPHLQVTQDAGNTWQQATFRLPQKYESIFVQAEVPFKEGDHLAVLVNQGDSGDYQGGLVKGKFRSNDNGLTWTFSQEVAANEGTN